MFEQKDYFMKIVQQFAMAIGKIMGFKAENKFEECQEALSDTLKYFTNLNREVLEALPYEILIHKVSGGRQINTEKCLMLVELINQQADLYELTGEQSRAKSLYIKSFNILVSALLNSDDLDSEQNKSMINNLIDKIGLYNVPIESKSLLFQYYDASKNFAKAEDVLFDMLESAGSNHEILAKGIEFYERLKDLDPNELEKGNLPMDEVLEGLASLKSIRD